MVQIIPEQDIWGQAAQGFGAGAVQGYQSSADQKALQKAIQGIPKGASMQDTLNAVMGVHTYSDESKLKALDNLYKSYAADQSALAKKQTLEKEVKKKETEQRQGKEIAKQHGRSEEEAERLSKTLTPQQILQTTKPEKGAKKDLSVAEKALQKRNVDRYIEAQDDLPKIRQTLSDLDELEKLGDKLKGATGYIKSGLNLSSASEFDTLATSLIQPVVKIFNPVGAIAQKKFEVLRSLFAPKSGELRSTQQGKINTLRRLAKEAETRAQQWVNLFEQHEGNPSEKEVNEFNKNNEKIIDALNKSNPETGKLSGYYDANTGEELFDIPIEDIAELITKGLITNEPRK